MQMVTLTCSQTRASRLCWAIWALSWAGIILGSSISCCVWSAISMKTWIGLSPALTLCCWRFSVAPTQGRSRGLRLDSSLCSFRLEQFPISSYCRHTRSMVRQQLSKEKAELFWMIIFLWGTSSARGAEASILIDIIKISWIKMPTTTQHCNNYLPIILFLNRNLLLSWL